MKYFFTQFKRCFFFNFVGKCFFHSSFLSQYMRVYESTWHLFYFKEHVINLNLAKIFYKAKTDAWSLQILAKTTPHHTEVSISWKSHRISAGIVSYHFSRWLIRMKCVQCIICSCIMRLGLATYHSIVFLSNLILISHLKMWTKTSNMIQSLWWGQQKPFFTSEIIKMLSIII